MKNKPENRPNLSVGDIVMSLAGRGGGRIFLVIDKVDDEYVKISDGKTRKLTNPKKKKNLHLLLIDKVEADADTLTDADIRKILKEVSI